MQYWYPVLKTIIKIFYSLNFNLFFTCTLQYNLNTGNYKKSNKNKINKKMIFVFIYEHFSLGGYLKSKSKYWNNLKRKNNMLIQL